MHRRTGIRSAADESMSYSHAHCRSTFRTGGPEYGHVVALQTYILHIACAYGPTVASGGPDPRVGMKGKRLLWNNHWMFQACELGSPLQGYEI
jgi:5-methylcytosine-specific restriction endonuclease McrA